MMRYEAERANERRADEREKTKAAAREAGADVIDLLSDGDDNGGTTERSIAAGDDAPPGPRIDYIRFRR